MELYSLALIATWLIPIWLLGWLVLPTFRHLFYHLPDGGLAAGRFTILVLVSLAAFWVASLHIAPLTYSPLLLAGIPCGMFIFSLRQKAQRKEFFSWIYQQRKALIISDIVFLLGFLFFVYLRLCQPEIRDQEKPMDSALIGVLSRTSYLPADNPWFSGVPFTNYYYFGHFMAAMLKRVFCTPLPYAYNLIQPVFCAFFLSILWSLCTAIARSLRAGVLAMVFIALCGNFEPARQLFTAWKNHAALWPLDWWSTSRVVPNTINEYPFFTLALGDAHAHFFGLSLGVLFLSVCYGIIRSHHIAVNRARLWNIGLSAIVLGAIIITNSWDAPLYFFVGIICLFIFAKTLNRNSQILTITRFCVLCFLWATVPLITALPFLWKFQSPTHGIAWEIWVPPPAFFLYWGGLLCAACYVLAYTALRKMRSDKEYRFHTTLLTVGLVGIILPSVFYIRGHFEGELRHQDTVFKFWLQSWLLLGIPIFCALSNLVLNIRLIGNQSISSPSFKKSLSLHSAAICLALYLIPAFCSLLVATNRMANKYKTLSLNGARFLSQADQSAISWVEIHASPDTVIIESIGRNPDGTIIGAYTDYGRMSFLSGVPTYLGWSQHVGFWGAEQQQIEQRQAILQTAYTQRFIFNSAKDYTQSPSSRRNKQIKTTTNSQTNTWLIWGELECEQYGQPAKKTKPLALFDGSQSPGDLPFNNTYIFRIEP